MMRKDVKLGFAIGGVLLAVLVVYVLVGTGGDRKPVADSGVAVVTEEPSASTTVKTSTDNPNESKPGATPPGVINTIPPSGASGTTSLASNGTNSSGSATRDANKDLWGAALNDGKLLMTETPDTTSTAKSTPSDIPGGGSPRDRAGKTPDTRTDAPATLPSRAETPHNESDVVTGGPGAANTPANVDASNTSTSSAMTPAAAAPLPTESSSAPHAVARTHVVQKNETLASIAEMAYGNRNLYPAIMRANPNLDPKKMRPGMTIVLPPVSEVRPDPSGADRASSAAPASHTAGSLDSRSEYRVSSGDTLERISMKLYGKRDMIDKIYELNKEKIGPDRDKLRLGMVLKLPEPPTAATR